jgi:hypothetical protein
MLSMADGRRLEGRQPSNETHTAHREMSIRDIIAKMSHDGCGGMAARVELLTGNRGRQQPPGVEDRADRRLSPNPLIANGE